MPERQTHVYSIYIRTTPDALWHALTDAELTKHYNFGTSLNSTWEKGAPYRFTYPDGSVALEGEVLEIDPPRKLVTTFRPQWDEEGKKDRSIITYEIEQHGELCKLTLTHDKPDGPIHPGFIDAWALTLSGLKSILETGQPLSAAASM